MITRPITPPSYRILIMPLAALRRALWPAVALVLLCGGSTARAQQISTSYAPSCGPGTGCPLVRFSILNTAGSALLINSLTLTAASAPFRFAPSTGGATLYEAVDAIGPFGGSGTVAVGGTSILINFLGGNGFAFELTNPGASGYVELALTQTPVLTGQPFTYSAVLDGGQTVAGTINAVPEPSTIVLLSGGLAIIGFVSRQRRRAA